MNLRHKNTKSITSVLFNDFMPVFSVWFDNTCIVGVLLTWRGSCLAGDSQGKTLADCCILLEIVGHQVPLSGRKDNVFLKRR